MPKSGPKNVQKKFKKMLTGPERFEILQSHTEQHTNNMRTKTLLLAAALSAAGLATSLAQSNVYSLNVVGYVNIVFPGGLYKAVGNPLNAPTNTLRALIPTAPGQSTFAKFNAAGTAYDIWTFFLGAWTPGGTAPPEATLAPGEGGLLNNAGATFTNTFVGEVMQGNLTNPFPAGFSIRASQVPQAGDANVLGLTAAIPNQSVLSKVSLNNINPSFYILYTKVAPFIDPSGWQPAGGPSLEVGEAFVLQAVAAGNWTRSFTVQ